MKKAKLVFWLILIAIAALFVYQNPEFFLAKHRLTLKLGFIDPLFTPELPTLVYFLIALGLGFLLAILSRFTSQLKTRKTTREMTSAIDARDRKIKQLEEEVGLVMQPFNSQKIGGMCSCCGDCCGMLRSLKKQPIPSEAVQSNYYARVDEALCTGCETCVERCQIEAVEVVDGISTVHLDRCIGCGLCGTTCPTEAIGLIKKDNDRLYEPPKSGGETYMRIMQERGKL